MFKIKKHLPLTMIEVFIGMGLMSIVIYTLFSTFLSTLHLSKALKEIKRNSYQASFCYNRLLPVLSKASSDKFDLIKNDDGEIIQTSFEYENGLDKALIFSGTVKGEIYLDEKSNLKLNTFSKDQKMCQSEVLLTGVKHLSFIEKLPYFLTLEITRNDDSKKEFVFFFSDRKEDKGAYQI